MRPLLALFWIHQVIFGLASFEPIVELVFKGGTSGQLNLIPLLLAWIAGSLTFGLSAIVAGIIQQEPGTPIVTR
jgi:hypothetical protein